MPIAINQDDTLAMSQADFAKSIDDTNKQQLTPTASKIQNLQSRTQEKINLLSGYKKDTLLGMQDADSETTANNGSNAREALMPNAYAYDAIEVKHQTGVDAQGNPVYTDPLSYVQKSRHKQWQIDYVAKVLGKQPNEVTTQDMQDVGQQQTIQKLADLAGHPEWKAPLIRNTPVINVTGENYRDKNGNLVNGDGKIPLDVPIMSKDWKQQGYYGRELMSYADAKGRPVTVNAAIDPAQNGLAAKAAKVLINGAPTTTVPGRGLGQYTDKQIQEIAAKDANAAIAEQSSWNPLRLGKALVSGFGRSIYDMVDTGGDIVTGLYARATDGKMHDLMGTTAQKDKYEQELGVGLSAKAQANNNMAGKYADKAFDQFTNGLIDFVKHGTIPSWKGVKETTSNLYTGVKYGLSTPENAARSLGYLAPFMIGSLEKIGAKVIGKAAEKTTADEIAIKSLDTLNKRVAKGEVSKAAAQETKKEIFNSVTPEIQAKLNSFDEVSAKYFQAGSKADKKLLVGKYKKAIKELYVPTQAEQHFNYIGSVGKLLDEGKIGKKEAKQLIKDNWNKMDWRGKVSSILATSSPVVAYGAITANQDLDSYYKQHGKLATIPQVLAMTTIDSLTGLVDIRVMKDVIKGPGFTEKLAEKIIGSAKNKNVAKRIVARIGEQALKYAAVMPEEFSQEMMQNTLQAYNAKYGGLDLKGLTDKEIYKQGIEQSIMAPGSAVHMHAGGSAFHTITNRNTKAVSTGTLTQPEADTINEDIQAVQSWDGDPTAKVNEYIRAKRSGKPHNLTADQEKHVPGYIMAHIVQGNDQIKALQTLINSPDVSEQDKIAHEATIEGLKSNIAQQWMAYNDVTNNDDTVLNNRPIEEINKDIQNVNEQIASESGDKSQLEYQRKVLAVEKHIAEQLKLPEFEKLAKQLDKNVATDGVNTQGKQIATHETLANKIYNGASDESGVKRGMLEYARILLNPNIPEEAKQGVIGEMNKFLNSQDRKEAAILAAKAEFEANGGIAPVSKPYGMYADGRTAEVEYRGAQTKGLVNSIVAENTLMKSIRDQIMNEGQTNEQSSTTTTTTTTGQNEPVQTGTENGTKTEEGSGTVAGQNEKGGSIREEAPTSQIGEQGTFTFDEPVEPSKPEKPVESKKPSKPVQSNEELLKHPRLNELLGMWQDVLAKDIKYAQVLTNKRYISNGDNGRLDTTITPAGYEKNWNAEFSLTTKDIAHIRKQIKDSKEIKEEVYNKLRNDLGVLDNNAEWALQDTTQLSDKEKLLEEINNWKIKAAQTENVADTEIDKRKTVLGKLVDKLYADHWKEDPKVVKDKIDEVVAYADDIAPDNVKWLKKLIEAKAAVKQIEKQVEASKNEIVRLQAKLDDTAKMVVDGLLKKIDAIKKDYEAKYAGTTKELTAATKEANRQTKEVVGVGPFAGGKINTDKLIEGSQATLKDKREKVLQPIENKIDNANSQLDNATANLADSQDKLAKMQEGYNQSKSNNTVGAAVMKKHSRKEGEVNEDLAKAVEKIPDEFQNIFNNKAGCK